MIVKFLKRGSGSCKAAMNYLLGTKNDREGARLLAGQPELTQRLSDSLSFKNRYTVGVLSFEETNLPDDSKRAIMDSFESNLFAGLEKDQYNITWIEHTDKDRLELNFVIANTELTTGKHLQPYFDRVDRPLVENWKQVTNHEYQLTDPHDPKKAVPFKTLNRQNLPQDLRGQKQEIGEFISERIELGYLTDRKDVIDTLEQGGFEIARLTEKSISIKNPNGKRNIRLEGIIYENRRFGTESEEERRSARQDYAAGSAERYRTALNKLQRAIEVKQERNRASFGREYQDYQREQNRLAAGIGMENDARGTDGRSSDRIPHSATSEYVARREPEKQESGISGDYRENRAIANRAEIAHQDNSTGMVRRERRDSSNTQDQSDLGKESEQRTGAIHQPIRLEHERLFNTLQRASGRTGEQELTAATTDRTIDRSQSSIARVEHQIRETDKSIGERERATSDHQQEAEQFAQRSRETVRSVSHDRGMER